MLTRSQVAKKLGKSIATVRRLEGVELFPRRDRRGVHWFELREVDELKGRIDDGHNLPRGISSSRVGWKRANDDELANLCTRVTALEDTLEELVEALRD